jgi:hypothetical protein
MFGAARIRFGLTNATSRVKSQLEVPSIRCSQILDIHAVGN